ncbi:MAG: TonB-dependent receptor, partial [Verrucomicrobiae bacterium]|nr:TonB-dependent receptor [Verrucomicrobiae bacterium]
AQYDPCAGRNLGINTPLFVAATFTEARFDGDARSSNPDSPFCGARDGNDVPYIPRWECMVGAGLHLRNCGAELRVVYQSETFTSGSNSTVPVNPVTGRPDARIGKTDEIFTVDISAYYRLNPRAKLIGSIQNVFDEEYIVSRHPHGPRPNKPFTALIGLEVRF